MAAQGRELPRKAALPAKAPGKANFYVLSSDNSGTRLSSFTAGYSSVLSTVMDISSASGYAGTSVGGDFYYCDYSANSSGGITAVNWNCVDVAAKSVTFTKSQTTANAVCMDMTYDASTSTIYGMSAMADVLVTIDPASGKAEFAVETLPFYTLSADAGGQLYGILLEADGEAALYTVNKLTGQAVKVGNTGVKMLTSDGYAYFQTAAFSRNDGRLYWLTPSASGTDLYRVDVATGRASMLCTLETLEALCLFDLPGEVDSASPAPVSDIVATAEGMSVRLDFKAPSTTAGGDALAVLSGIEIYRGGDITAVYSITNAEPGKSYTWTDSEAKAGSNTYRLVAVNDKGESLPAYATAFCGEDYPVAPASLTATTGDNGYPLLSWSAPTKGLNGLDVDPAKLSYNIYRDVFGSEELIATGVTATNYLRRRPRHVAAGLPLLLCQCCHQCRRRAEVAAGRHTHRPGVQAAFRRSIYRGGPGNSTLDHAVAGLGRRMGNRHREQRSGHRPVHRRRHVDFQGLCRCCRGSGGTYSDAGTRLRRRQPRAALSFLPCRFWRRHAL